MLMAFLESGNTLSSLSRSQMRTLERAFTLYLIHAIKFNDAVKICYKVLDEDQDHMRVVIKEKLTQLIADPNCNMIYKPAILRLAFGDPVIFRQMKYSTTSTLNILENNYEIIKPQLNKICFPVDQLGPDHIRSLENEFLRAEKGQKSPIERHALGFIRYSARFLTKGDSGLSEDDMCRDLMILAVRVLRIYYPFRNKLHLLNTMRNSITNRGKTAIKYNVVPERRRVFMDEQGNTINRESTALYASASDWLGYADNPAPYIAIQRKISDLVHQGGTSTYLALEEFIKSEAMQDRFLSWIEYRYGIKEDDFSLAIKKTGKSYIYLLSKFLNLGKNDVAEALRKLRNAA